MPIQATKAGSACFLDFGFWILDSGFWILDSGFCTLRHSTLTIQSAGQEDCTAPGTPRRCRPTCELVTRLRLAGGRKLGDLGVEAVADPRAAYLVTRLCLAGGQDGKNLLMADTMVWRHHITRSHTTNAVPTWAPPTHGTAAPGEPRLRTSHTATLHTCIIVHNCIEFVSHRLINSQLGPPGPA